MSFKDLKIGTKLMVGTGTILLIAAALGILAIINFSTMSDQSNQLDNENVPQVNIANAIEQNVLLAMYTNRAYGYTEDEQFLIEGREYLFNVYEAIKQAKDLAKRSPHLLGLGEQVDTIDETIKKYEEFLDKTVEQNKKLETLRSQMVEAADQFMSTSYDFLDSQKEQYNEDVQRGVIKEKLLERMNKVSMVNEIIYLGNAIMLDNFKAQALRKSAIMEATLKNYDKLNALYTQILSIR